MKIPTNNVDKLQTSFPKLTDTNQHFVLGIAEGLKHAQEKNGRALKKKIADYEKSDFFTAEIKLP